MVVYTKKKRLFARGFTLIELLVVISIGLLLTSMAIAQYFPYIDKIDYENTVLDIALRIREFQTYGVSTKQNINQSFNTGYGIHTSVGSPAFIFFQDVNPSPNGNGLYDSGASCTPPECVTQVAMNSYVVSSIYAGGSNLSSNSTVDFLFKRPYFNVHSSTNGGAVLVPSQINMCILDPTVGMTEYNPLVIVIYQTGQISIKQADTSSTTGLNASPPKCNIKP